jgi:hypothetical protein
VLPPIDDEKKTAGEHVRIAVKKKQDEQKRLNMYFKSHSITRRDYQQEKTLDANMAAAVKEYNRYINTPIKIVPIDEQFAIISRAKKLAEDIDRLVLDDIPLIAASQGAAAAGITKDNATGNLLFSKRSYYGDQIESLEKERQSVLADYVSKGLFMSPPKVLMSRSVNDRAALSVKEREGLR